MRENLEIIKNCLQREKRSLAFLAAGVILTYGFMASHFSYSIDTEDMLAHQLAFYPQWISIDRWGLVLTKKIFGVMNLVPGFESFLMIFWALAAGSMMIVLFRHLSDLGGLSVCGLAFAVPVYFFASTPVVEKINFRLESAEVMFGMLLAVSALFFEWRWIEEKHFSDLVISAVCLIWSFATYQSFVAMYVCASIVSYLFVTLKNCERSPAESFSVCVRLVLVFLVGLAGMKAGAAAVRAFTGVEATSYTDQMILWGRVPSEELIKGILRVIKDRLGPNQIWYNRTYPFTVAAVFVLGIKTAADFFLGRRRFGFVVPAMAVYLISPFFLLFIVGAVSPARSEWALPFTGAAGLLLAVSYAAEGLKQLSDEGKLPAFFRRNLSLILTGAACLLFLLCLRKDIVRANRLYYTEYNVKQQEAAMTEEILLEIRRSGAPDDARVAVIGSWSPLLNGSMLKGNAVGYSFYEWDAHIPGAVSKRVTGYWNSMGYDYRDPSEKEMARAEKAAARMPVWPADGSVVRQGEDLVIVRLS